MIISLFAFLFLSTQSFAAAGGKKCIPECKENEECRYMEYDDISKCFPCKSTSGQKASPGPGTSKLGDGQSKVNNLKRN